jgi:hypothetical protein
VLQREVTAAGAKPAGRTAAIGLDHQLAAQTLPSQSAMTVVSTSACRRRIAAV